MAARESDPASVSGKKQALGAMARKVKSSQARKKKARATSRLVLIFGEPHNGKTYLAKELEERGFQVIHTDEEYVKFIQEKGNEIYFPLLRGFIQQHFMAIVPGASSAIGRDLVLCQSRILGLDLL